MSDIDRIGIERAMREALDRVSGPGFVHVSLDLDALDPEVAPGVGTPVRGGLTYREAQLACELIAEAGTVGSFELVEANPILDRENTTALPPSSSPRARSARRSSSYGAVATTTRATPGTVSEPSSATYPWSRIRALAQGLDLVRREPAEQQREHARGVPRRLPPLLQRAGHPGHAHLLDVLDLEPSATQPPPGAARGRRAGTGRRVRVGRLGEAELERGPPGVP